MSDDNRIAWGKLIHVFIKAGWNPPPPSTRIADRVLEDIRQPGYTSSQGATLDLSSREVAFLADSADGLTFDQIARKHGVSAETVKTRLTKARQRLGAKNTAHAVAIALRGNVLPRRPNPRAASLSRSRMRRPAWSSVLDHPDA